MSALRNLTTSAVVGQTASKRIGFELYLVHGLEAARWSRVTASTVFQASEIEYSVVTNRDRWWVQAIFFRCHHLRMIMRQPAFGHIDPSELSLFTDRYELTMMEGYYESGHNLTATFSVYFRRLPLNPGYAIAAGLKQVINYVEMIEFDDDALIFLADQGFDEGFLSYLESFEFTGEIRALAERMPVFLNEPLLEVTAPIVEAQLFKTLVLNQVGFQTLVATKGARMADIVRGRGDGQALIDFGSRRAHGTDAGLKAARAAYVGGLLGNHNSRRFSSDASEKIAVDPRSSVRSDHDKINVMLGHACQNFCVWNPVRTACST